MTENEIGDKIRKLRLKHRITQRELAYNLGVTERTVNRWESGENVPRLKQIEKIEKLFKITL